VNHNNNNNNNNNNNDLPTGHRLGVVSGLDFLTLFLAIVCSTCVVGCFFVGYRTYHWRRYGFVHLGSNGSGNDEEEEASMYQTYGMFEMGTQNDDDDNDDADDTKEGGKVEKNEAESEWVDLAVSEGHKHKGPLPLSSKPTSPQISSSYSPYMVSAQTPAMDASIFDSSSTSTDEAGPSSSLSTPPIHVKTLRHQKDVDGKQD